MLSIPHHPNHANTHQSPVTIKPHPASSHTPSKPPHRPSSLPIASPASRQHNPDPSIIPSATFHHHHTPIYHPHLPYPQPPLTPSPKHPPLSPSHTLHHHPYCPQHSSLSFLCLWIRFSRHAYKRLRSAVVSMSSYKSASQSSNSCQSRRTNHPAVHPPNTGWLMNIYQGKPGEGDLWEPGCYICPVNSYPK